jgi:hypothetical protein
MSDVIDFDTAKLTKAPGDRHRNAEVSRKLQNRQRLKRVLEEIGQGKSPTSGIIEGTSPSYWVIRTGDTSWEEEECEDGFYLKDEISQAQYELWRGRGGRGVVLRLSADPVGGPVLVWLIDATSGASCLGVNFPARPSSPVERNFMCDKQARISRHIDREKWIRRFVVVENDLCRDHERLLKYLKRRGAVDMDLEHLEKTLHPAPALIVMPEAGIDMRFWEMRGETVKKGV